MLDVLVVGAGFGGMYALHKFRGLGMSVQVIERGDGVGGTWYWNRYPGARCDVESLEYSYSFDEDLQAEWRWTEKYAPQPEILAYAEHVADRFDLRRDIRFGTSVVAAHWQEGDHCWRVSLDSGEFVEARFCVMATGCLSSTNKPDFPGLDAFEGPVYHTGEWPHEHPDFSGQHVGIIGTGSSAIQSIPILAEEAAHLTVFQRTPNFSVPANNGPIDPDYEARVRADYAGFRARNREMGAAFGSNMPRGDGSIFDDSPEERTATLEARWQRGGLGFLGGYIDCMISRDANAVAAEFVHNKIHDIVDDPATADLLCPDQVIGCKRMCVDTGYFATYNRDNVTLVDISDTPITEITPHGLDAGGRHFEFDALVLATGFDAMTGTLLRIDIRGRDGVGLADAWAEGPKTYLGLNVHGFPNLFMVTGPGSPSVLTNMIMSIEQHVEWIADLITAMGAAGQQVVEAEADAQENWVRYVNGIADLTLYPHCNSWYLGANIPGKPRVFMPHLGFPTYVERCNAVAANDYEGFFLS